MTKPKMKDTDLRKQLANDFVLYAKHPNCDQLFVFIYDPLRQIDNRVGFEHDMAEPRLPLQRVRTFVQQG